MLSCSYLIVKAQLAAAYALETIMAVPFASGTVHTTNL
jgi:hypothetical protein